MGKLTGIYFGLMLLAGWAGFACSQKAEPVEVGTVQAELRSDLILPESPGSSMALPVEENSNHGGQLTKPIVSTQRIALPDLENYSQDRAYRAVKRYEFLPVLLRQPKTRKNSAQKGNAHASSWALADKHWVRAGKGFERRVGCRESGRHQPSPV